MRPESPELATIDDTLACLIGIRVAISVLTDRNWRGFSKEDREEIHRILDWANDIQANHLKLRSLVSAAYQNKKAK